MIPIHKISALIITIVNIKSFIVYNGFLQFRKSNDKIKWVYSVYTINASEDYS